MRHKKHARGHGADDTAFLNMVQSDIIHADNIVAAGLKDITACSLPDSRRATTRVPRNFSDSRSAGSKRVCSGAMIVTMAWTNLPGDLFPTMAACISDSGAPCRRPCHQRSSEKWDQQGMLADAGMVHGHHPRSQEPCVTLGWMERYHTSLKAVHAKVVPPLVLPEVRHVGHTAQLHRVHPSVRQGTP
jgi:hypothetical protein